MTDHPCKGMTKAQITTFEKIAVNQPTQSGGKTIDALLAHGVIEHGKSKKRRDAMGVYEIPTFTVPLLVHMQWCEWCSEQPENQEST
jgi:hypothetical protein